MGDHIQCPGGVMPDGCPMPDTCMPVTANCPAAACPAVCNFATDMTCPGGVDASGCMLPDTRMPQTEECPTIVDPAPVCENIHADNKCIKNKNKGKCGKKWMKKKAKKNVDIVDNANS